MTRETLRGRFSEYYPPTDSDFKALWRDAGISLDANALIDLFRVSEEAAADVLAVLGALGQRVWVSHQAALEFHQALPGALGAEATYSGEILKQLEETERTLEKRPMMLPTSTGKKLDEALSEVRREVEKRRDRLTKNMVDGSLHREISKVLGDRIGAPFNEDERRSIFVEGKARYARLQPPGFADREKKAAAGDERLYGDLLVWKQCIAHFGSDSAGFIFVTGEKKADWIRQGGGRTLGPHPELVGEYFALTGRRFHLYDLKNFLMYGSKHVAVTVKETSIREVEKLPARSEAGGSDVLSQIQSPTVWPPASAFAEWFSGERAGPEGKFDANLRQFYETVEQIRRRRQAKPDPSES